MSETSYTFTNVVPRYVPIGVKLRVRFGGILGQVGWLVLGFGLVFVWAFGIDATIASLIAWRGETDTAAGVVRACEDTGGKANNVTIYRNVYTFTAADGSQHEGASYATGKQLAPGTSVTVVYVKDNPAVSRIRDMRSTLMGAWGLFILIFPLVGLVLVAASLVRSRKRLRLLRDGITAVGTLVDKQATNTSVNHQRVYKFTYAFTADDGGTYRATARTHETGKFSDENEPLLYDPANPNVAVMMDNIPGSPRIDEAGDIHTDKPFLSMLVLVIPLATIIGYGLVIAHRYF